MGWFPISVERLSGVVMRSKMDVINRDYVNAFTTKDTSTIREILAPRNSSLERQSLAEATLAPGAKTQAHLHPQTEEIYYILSGTGCMAIEGEQQQVSVGDGIPIPVGRRHQILNTGTEDLVFLCCCVPAYTDADTEFCEPLIG
jgi:mannose-6-phosphate isomerase-like protein (cupin superfamily)